MSDILLSKDLGLLRVAVAVPELRIANIDFNIAAILKLLEKAKNEGVQIIAFPEMAVTGYTIGDLVQQETLLVKAQQGLLDILKVSSGSNMVVAVGIPLPLDQKIFNCAVVLNSGRVLGVIPKTFLPSYREFY
jgi:NAD+ synthase (glutamine-hydrolysing)